MFLWTILIFGYFVMLYCILWPISTHRTLTNLRKNCSDMYLSPEFIYEVVLPHFLLSCLMHLCPFILSLFHNNLIHLFFHINVSNMQPNYSVHSSAIWLLRCKIICNHVKQISQLTVCTVCLQQTQFPISFVIYSTKSLPSPVKYIWFKDDTSNCSFPKGCFSLFGMTLFFTDLFFVCDYRGTINLKMESICCIFKICCT